MKTIFNFGKIAYHGNRKINLVEIEMELRRGEDSMSIDLVPLPEYSIFATSATVWNSQHTDCIACGQMLNRLYFDFFKDNELFKTIYTIWKRWHLNNFKQGTRKQMDALKEHFEERKDYDVECEYLKSIGLYEDRGYRYGSGWLVEPIPDNIVNAIEQLIKSNEEVENETLS